MENAGLEFDLEGIVSPFGVIDALASCRTS